MLKISVISAILTLPDLFTMLLMAVPLITLLTSPGGE